MLSREPPSEGRRIYAIQVLSHLACASLREDKYEVVQRDLPKILEAFLSFLGALKDYRTEIVKDCPSHDDIVASSGKEQEDKPWSHWVNCEAL